MGNENYMAWLKGVFGRARRSVLLSLILAATVMSLSEVSRSSAHSVLAVPAYQQEYPLSCEFASLYIVTSYWGMPIYEYQSLAVTSWSSNPHYGFRGDIWGAWGNTWDYGIYAESLADIAWNYGYGSDISYGADSGTLTHYLDDGIPVIVWASVLYEPGWYEFDENGDSFKIVPFEHVFVVYGYDDFGVYISDPGPGNYNFLTWDYFLNTWAIMDGMMLAVYPM